MVTEAKRIEAKPVYTGTCDTMTFEEAWEAITTGKPFNAIFRIEEENGIELILAHNAYASNGVITISGGNNIMYWTSDGISSVEPSSGK